MRLEAHGDSLYTLKLNGDPRGERAALLATIQAEIDHLVEVGARLKPSIPPSVAYLAGRKLLEDWLREAETLNVDDPERALGPALNAIDDLLLFLSPH